MQFTFTTDNIDEAQKIMALFSTGPDTMKAMFDKNIQRAIEESKPKEGKKEAPKKEAPKRSKVKGNGLPKDDGARQVKTYPVLSIDGIAPETLDGFSPSLVAMINSTPHMINGGKTRGTHPFFVGSASFLNALPKERRARYMKAFALELDEYPTNSSYFDGQEAVDAMKVHGVNPDVMGSIIVDDKSTTLDTVTEPVVDDKVLKGLKSEKNLPKLKAMLSAITDQPNKLWNFMSALYIDKQLTDDLRAIGKAVDKGTMYYPADSKDDAKLNFLED